MFGCEVLSIKHVKWMFLISILILATLRSHESILSVVDHFTLKDFSYNSDQMESAQVEVNSFNEISRTSTMICDAFLKILTEKKVGNITFESLSHYDHLRCRGAIFQSLRVKRYITYEKLLKEAQLPFFFPSAAHFFALSSFYGYLDGTYDLPVPEKRHVCVLGDVHINSHHHLLAAIAMLPFVDKISFVQLSFLLSTLNTPEESILFNDKTASATMDLGTSHNLSSSVNIHPSLRSLLHTLQTNIDSYLYEYVIPTAPVLEGLQYIPSDCDIIVITLSQTVMNVLVNSLTLLLNHLYVEKSTLDTNLIRILNWYPDEMIPAEVYRDDLFHWQLSSTWTSVGEIKEATDSNGFVAKQYSYNDVYRTVTVTLIGHYNPTITKVETSSSLISPINGESSLLEQKESSKVASLPAVYQTDDVIILITYTIRVFAETAIALQTQLRDRLQYPYTFVVLEVTVDVLKNIRELLESEKAENTNEYPKKQRKVFLQIAIGPHDITTLLYRHRYIAWHMEQSWSAFLQQFHHAYDLVLANALQIWMFSEKQGDQAGFHKLLHQKQQQNSQERLKSNASVTLTLPKLHIVPLYSHISMIGKMWYADRYVARRVYRHPNSAVYHTMPKVMLFGSSSPRRYQILNDEYYPACEEANFTLNAFCGGWDATLFDNKRDAIVDRSDIILNLHTHEDSVLEIHRIHYLLGRGKCIVSERGTDLALSKKYEGVVHFISNATEAVNMIQYLAEEVFDNSDNSSDNDNKNDKRLPLLEEEFKTCSFVRKDGSKIVEQTITCFVSNQSGRRPRLEACEKKSFSLFQKLHSLDHLEQVFSEEGEGKVDALKEAMDEALRDLAMVEHFRL